MPKGQSNKVAFKPYQQHQLNALPPSLEDLIPPNHLVRVVNSAIDNMDIKSLLKKYKGGGASRYHPRVLLKLLVYGYSQRIYSSRQIAKAIRENVHFMWLAGGNQPDFRTLNRFRSSRLKGVIDDVFMSIAELLIEAGLINLKDYFLDGTKLEANANKYSFVWGKSTKKFKTRLQNQLRTLLREIDAVSDAENKTYGDRDLEEMGEHSEPLSAEQIKAKLAELEQRLAERNKDDQAKQEDDNDPGPDQRTLKKAVKKIKEDYLPRQEKYEAYEKILGDRNSFSKTDHDATFMRMKDDHMQNGQLKAGYNLQMGTQNQFILAYSLHQHPTDTGLLIPHLQHVSQLYGFLPEKLTADAGYGSEENYRYLQDRKITSYVKYNNFHFEQSARFKKNPFRVENLPHDEKTDTYICPANRKLTYLETKTHVTKNGYEGEHHIYQCENCEGCSLRSQCHQAKSDRTIQINPRLKQYRDRARELLNSPEGKKRRSQRPVEVEAVFGQIKQNFGVKRFKLRGMDKVKIEFGLTAIAHNLKKWFAKGYKNQAEEGKIRRKNGLDNLYPVMLIQTNN